MKYAPVIAACSTTTITVVAALIITKDLLSLIGLLSLMFAVALNPKS